VKKWTLHSTHNTCRNTLFSTFFISLALVIKVDANWNNYITNSFAHCIFTLNIFPKHYFHTFSHKISNELRFISLENATIRPLHTRIPQLMFHLNTISTLRIHQHWTQIRFIKRNSQGVPRSSANDWEINMNILKFSWATKNAFEMTNLLAGSLLAVPGNPVTKYGNHTT
jgi:hypothetical protein